MRKRSRCVRRTARSTAAYRYILSYIYSFGSKRAKCDGLRDDTVPAATISADIGDVGDNERVTPRTANREQLSSRAGDVHRVVTYMSRTLVHVRTHTRSGNMDMRMRTPVFIGDALGACVRPVAVGARIRKVAATVRGSFPVTSHVRLSRATFRKFLFAPNKR